MVAFVLILRVFEVTSCKIMDYLYSRVGSGKEHLLYPLSVSQVFLHHSAIHVVAVTALVKLALVGHSLGCCVWIQTLDVCAFKLPFGLGRLKAQSPLSLGSLLGHRFCLIALLRSGTS